MNFTDLLNSRRSYRAIEPACLNENTIKDLFDAARLAPSCMNNQPWRYKFITSDSLLSQQKLLLAKGNDWAHPSDLIIAVYTNAKQDCIIGTTEYAAFDTGMATAFMMLKATELGFVIHPIAGFDHTKTHELLQLSPEDTIITLLIIGKHSETKNSTLPEKQQAGEQTRPDRKSFSDCCVII